MAKKMNAGDAIVYLNADLSKFQKAWAQAGRDTKKNLGAIVSTIKSAGRGIESIGNSISSISLKFAAGGAAAVAALSAMVYKVVEMGSEIQDTADMTGMSTEALSELGFAARASGGDMSDMIAATRGMAKTLDAAKKEAKEAAEKIGKGGMATATGQATETLQRLGLKLEDFKGLNPDQTFMKYAEAIGAVTDPMEQTALAQEVFGRSSMKLLPLLRDNAAGLKEMRERAREVGYSFSAETIKKIDDFGDSIFFFKASMMAASAGIVKEALPELQRGINWLIEEVGKFAKYIKEHSEDIKAGFVTVADYIREKFQGLVNWFEANKDSIKEKVGALIDFFKEWGPLLLKIEGYALVFGPIISAVGSLVIAFGGLLGWTSRVIFFIRQLGVVLANTKAISAFAGWIQNLVGPNMMPALSRGLSLLVTDIANLGRNMGTFLAKNGAAFLGWIRAMLGTAAGGAIGASLGILGLTAASAAFIQMWTSGDWTHNFLTDFIDKYIPLAGKAIDALMDKVYALRKILALGIKDLSGITQDESFKRIGAEILDKESPIPGAASGGQVRKAGMSWVGERGPELIFAPRGAEVIPSPLSRMLSNIGRIIPTPALALPARPAMAMAGAGGGNVTLNVTMPGMVIREQADVDRLAEAFYHKAKNALMRRGLNR